MNDIKKFFKLLREWWKNPRFKGIVQIIFWVIFFIIVAIIFRTAESNDVDNIKLEKKENVDVVSYDYIYQFKDSSVNFNIEGTYYEGKESFNMNNKRYYFRGGFYYDALSKEIVKINYAINEWSYNSIKNIMDNNSYTNKTNYKSGDIKYEYIINSLVYNSYYSTNYPKDILINVTANKKIISEVFIDYGFASVNINYKNINEIDSLDINID